MTGAGSARHGASEARKSIAVENAKLVQCNAFNFELARPIEPNEAAAPLWAFGEP